MRNLLCFSVMLAAIFVGNIATGWVLGGYTNEEPATPEIQEFYDEVKTTLDLQQLGCGTSKVFSFMTQLVSGRNYLLKVEVCLGTFVAIKIYEPLPYTGLPPELKGIVEIGENELLSPSLFQ